MSDNILDYINKLEEAIKLAAEKRKQAIKEYEEALKECQECHQAVAYLLVEYRDRLLRPDETIVTEGLHLYGPDQKLPFHSGAIGSCDEKRILNCRRDTRYRIYGGLQEIIRKITSPEFIKKRKHPDPDDMDTEKISSFTDGLKELIEKAYQQICKD